MSVGARGAPRHLVTSTRVAIVLAAAFAVACEDSPESAPAPTPSPMAAATATPDATTPTATPAPTIVAAPPATSTPQPTPTASPTATATPIASPTPTPTPTPSPTPTPEPPDALNLIKRSPDAFDHGAFESGESIDWDQGIFVLDPVTGLTDGYRVPGAQALHYYEHFPGGWIRSWDPSLDQALLLHRASGRSWRWPDAQLRLVSAWPGHLLFEAVRRPGSSPTGRLTLANAEMQEVARFSIDPASERSVLVSPDGQMLAIDAETLVYLISVESSGVTVLFEADPDDENARVWVDPWWGGPGIRISSSRDEGKSARSQSDHYFNWEGEAVAAPQCPRPDASWAGWFDGSAWTSPDGRYVAWLEGEPAFIKYAGFAPLDDPWPSLLIADAATCVPIFRVRSVRTGERAWNAEWLATSEGIVVGIHDGYVIVRVRPEPAIIRLPGSGRTGEWDTGPQPAPTGDGRYFGYGWRVYDALEDRWMGPPLDPWAGPLGLGYAAGPYWWGDSHRERWFSPTDYWGEGWVEWLLLAPRIESPPFSDEIAFRVARTGACLRIREDPDTNAGVLDCLPDGSRVVFVQRQLADEQAPYEHGLSFVHASLEGLPNDYWVYVRTEDGIEGWVSHGYLEHD